MVVIHNDEPEAKMIVLPPDPKPKPVKRVIKKDNTGLYLLAVLLLSIAAFMYFNATQEQEGE